MGPTHDCPCEGNPQLSVVSSDLQHGVTSVERNTLLKSAVLQGLLGEGPGSHTSIVLPVSTLGLQQWTSWASDSSNCFSALSEGLQVAHFLNDADTVHSISSQLADLLNLVRNWSTPVGTQLAAALHSMPADLCSTILHAAQMDLSHVLASLPAQFHSIGLQKYIKSTASGQMVNLSNQLPRSSMRPMSALTLQHCVHLDLTAASAAAPYPLPERVVLPSLTSLSLSKGRYTASGTIPFLSSLLTPTLKTLDLSYLHLKPHMYAALATPVAALTELTHMDITHRLGATQGSLCSKLLSPILSAASELPELCYLVGASVGSLSCVPDTLATLTKLSSLAIDHSECTSALADQLSAATALQALKVTVPPFVPGAYTLQAPWSKVDESQLIDVLMSVSPALQSLRIASIRTTDDVWAAPVEMLGAMTCLTSLTVAYTPLDTLQFLPSLIHLEDLHLVGTVPAVSDPAEFSTHLHALTALTQFEYDAGQEFDRTHVDPAVWSLGVDAGMLRGQLASSLPKLPHLAHLAFLTRDVEIEGDMDVAFVAALRSLSGLTTIRLDSSFSVATTGFSEWLETHTSLQYLELMDVQSQSADQCVNMHQALGSLVNLTRLELTWFGCPGSMERTVKAFADAVVHLTGLSVLELHGSVHDVQVDERTSSAVDDMLARALPALPQLRDISLQALQLASAVGASALTELRSLTALLLCDLVFKDVAAARRFGEMVASLPHVRRLRTDWVELIQQPKPLQLFECGEYGASPGGQSRLLSITGWLLTGDRMWGPRIGLQRTLRVLDLEDYHGLDWGVLGARVSSLSQLQCLEIDGMTFERKPAHAEALLRQMASLGNLEEVRLMTSFEVVASGFNEDDQARLQKLLPTALVSFIGHRMCGPNYPPLC